MKRLVRCCWSVRSNGSVIPNWITIGSSGSYHSHKIRSKTRLCHSWFLHYFHNQRAPAGARLQTYACAHFRTCSHPRAQASARVQTTIHYAVWDNWTAWNKKEKKGWAKKRQVEMIFVKSSFVQLNYDQSPWRWIAEVKCNHMNDFCFAARLGATPD